MQWLVNMELKNSLLNIIGAIAIIRINVYNMYQNNMKGICADEC